MDSSIIQLSFLLILVFGISIVIRLLKQPLIIAYIISGVLAGPYFLNLVFSQAQMQIFSDIGIVILLFIVGLNLNTKIIKDVGKVSLFAGLGQILFTSLLGYMISYYALGFSSITSLYIGVALTFSSTIIITKLLSDKGEIDTLHGRIAIGLLIVQDIFAILVLMLISSLSSELTLSLLIITTLIKWIFLLSAVGLIGFYIFPIVTKSIARSQEFLLLFSITWCFLVATAFYYMGFSIEIGALLAGVTLASSNYKYEIESKLKPLRDFFIIMFFIFVGNQIMFESLSGHLFQIISLTLFVIIFNPLILMIIMGVLNYTKKTNFYTSIIAAQISEFSLIMIGLGVRVGHLTQDTLSLVTIIGVITFTTSSYSIVNINSLYRHIGKYMHIFERKGKKEDSHHNIIEKKYDIVLLGYNRIGYAILKSLKALKDDYLVVDFNPDAIKSLNEQKIPCVYGDAGDLDFLDDLKIQNAKLVISTVPDFDSNMLLVEKIRQKNKESVVIVTGQNIYDGLELYNKGADYVILPHFIGGKYVSSLIKKYKKNKTKYIKEKNDEIEYITKKIAGELYHN